MSPVYGRGLRNIAITGQGIIDGSGDAWRPVKKFKMTEQQWEKLLDSGGAVNEKETIWWPSEQALHGAELVKKLNNKKNVSIEKYEAAREYLRPVMVNLVECKNVLLDGPTFQNSPAWNIHPLLCEGMIIRNINVRNPWYSQNGDGLDLESCRNVLVYDCRFDVGDDAICLKSGKDVYGRKRGKPCKNIIVENCIVYHGHGGFTIGSEMSGGIYNVSIRNCLFMGTDVGLRFKSRRGRGGVVENIYISNIIMTNIPTDAIRFNMFYGGQAPIPEHKESIEIPEIPIPPVTEETPQFQRIYINNVICRQAGRAVFLQGLPEMAIREIELNNVTISSHLGFLGIDADQIIISNVNIIPEQGSVYSFSNSRNVILKNTGLNEKIETFLKLVGKKTEAIRLVGMNWNAIKDKIQTGNNIRKEAVIVE
jgi:polygalacturonase